MNKADIIRKKIKEILKLNYELGHADCTIRAGTLWKELKSDYTSIKIDHQEISQVLFNLEKSNNGNSNIILQNNTKSGGAEVYLSCKFPTVIMFRDKTRVISELIRLDYAISDAHLLYPEQISVDNNKELFPEGALQKITVLSYERNQAARKECLKAHGYSCKICGFSFGEKYGEEFQYKIHVHHIVPLSEIQKTYEVDPIKDLIPVCPNCHMILHSKGNGETYSIDEVKVMLA